MLLRDGVCVRACMCVRLPKFGKFRKEVGGGTGWRSGLMSHDDCGDGWGRFLHRVRELSWWVDGRVKVETADCATD